jgi:hypothetical protein
MMHVQFHLDRHHERERDLHRKLEANRQRAEALAARPTPKSVLLSVVDGDAAEVAHLAALNEVPAPTGPHVLASVGGDVVAAQGLESKHPLTDPFRKTAHVVRLLALHAKCVLVDGHA